jgi:thiamine biosynthesis lipoprotein ApbE
MKYLFPLFLALGLSGCSKPGLGNIKRTFLRMDTIIEITVVGRDSPDLSRVWASLDSLLRDWEERFSQTHPRSEVLALNQCREPEVPVSEKLAAMLAAGRRYADTVQGIFDFTILPVKELWGLGEQRGPERIPPAESLARARQKVDYRKITVDRVRNRVHFAEPGQKIDLGGFAKSFAMEEAGAILEKGGYRNYLVVDGGDVLIKGRRADGKPGRIPPEPAIRSSRGVPRVGDRPGLRHPDKNLAFNRHSVYSSPVSESYTTPLPIPISPFPFSSITSVRIATLKQASPFGEIYPMAPV